MNNTVILFIIFSLLFGAVTFVSTNSLLCSGGVILISLLYFLFIAQKILKSYFLKSRRFHSCYTFINSFIISLSIKGSLMSAFDYVKLSMDKEYLSLVDGIASLKDEEKLDYLKSYFDFDIYKLFLSVIDIYINQGGDIFSISHYLILELRRNEDYLLKSESIGKRRIIDFALLWFFSLIILVILRFALSQFYSFITSLMLYKISIVGLFILILVSIHFLIRKYTQVFIRGFENVK